MRKKEKHFKAIQTATDQIDCSQTSPSVNEHNEAYKKKYILRHAVNGHAEPARAVRQLLADNVSAKSSSSCEISQVIQSLPSPPINL